MEVTGDFCNRDRRSTKKFRDYIDVATQLIEKFLSIGIIILRLPERGTETEE